MGQFHGKFQKIMFWKIFVFGLVLVGINADDPEDDEYELHVCEAVDHLLAAKVNSLSREVEKLKNAVYAECSSAVSRTKSYGGNTYTFYHKKHVHWPEAEDFCVKCGGHLASVHSQGEHDFIHNDLVKGFNEEGYPYVGVWLGGRALEKNGEYGWSDGTPWDYTNWAPSQPREPWNNMYDTHRLHIWKHYDYLWNDTIEEQIYPFVCKH